MFIITLSDTTVVRVDGDLDSGLPVVVLLHGLGGTSLDMTDPVTGRPGLAFDRNATYPLYNHEGFNIIPPTVPVAGFFLDPSVTALRSWRQALNGAGFTTVTYSQSAASGLIAPNVAQLSRLVIEALMGDPRLRGLRVAFVGHSRGGVIARAFLTSATTTPALAGFLTRVTALVTLHSPNLGSGLANLAASIDTAIATLQATFAGAGVTPPAMLTMLRGFTGNPAFSELAVGSGVLGAIAAAEPVAGVAYHTFGGTSTAVVRLWAKVYTPDSTFPLPLPFPLFHWGSVPVSIGAPLDVASFLPAAVLAPMPVITEMMTVLATLAATTPEFAPGGGDLLVSNARAHLPVSTSTTANCLNHVQALWDPTLQAQVIAILARLRDPAVSGQAVGRLNPFPASATPAVHTVTAADAFSGAPITTGTVTVSEADAGIMLTSPLGAPFTYGFASRRVRTFDPVTRRWGVAILEPSIELALPAPYGSVAVPYR